MVIDTSAIIAILSNEPDASQLAGTIAAVDLRFMSAASLLESAIVIESRYGPSGGQKLDELIATAEIQIEPVTVDQVSIARTAFRTYGKGRHPAGLNFGDCFAYALAKAKEVPLLFKGDDFSRTDIRAVPPG